MCYNDQRCCTFDGNSKVAKSLLRGYAEFVSTQQETIGEARGNEEDLTQESSSSG